MSDLFGSGPASSLYDGDVPYGPIDKVSMGVDMYDYLGATWDGFLDNDNLTFYALDRARMEINNAGIPNLPRADAEQKFHDAGVVYDVPSKGMSAEHVQYIIDYQTRKAAREEIFSRNDSTLNYALSIPTYFGAMVTDPLMVASAFLPVVREAKYVAGLKAAATPLGRAGVRAGYGAVEGVAGAVALEPFVAYQQLALGNEYGVANSLANAVFGGIFGGVAHPVAGVAADVLLTKKLRAYDAISSTEERMSILRDTIARTELDLPSDAERLISKNLTDKGYNPKEVSETIMAGEYGRGVLKEARETIEGARFDKGRAPGNDFLDEIVRNGGIKLRFEKGADDWQPTPNAGEIINTVDKTKIKSMTTKGVIAEDGARGGKTPQEMFEQMIEDKWFTYTDRGDEASNFDDFTELLRQAVAGEKPQRASGGDAAGIALPETMTARKEMREAGVTAKDNIDVAAEKLAKYRAERKMERDYTPDDLFTTRATDEPAPARSPEEADVAQAAAEARLANWSSDPRPDAPPGEQMSAPTKRQEKRAKKHATEQEELDEHLATEEEYMRAMKEEGLMTKEDTELLARADAEIKKIGFKQKAWDAVASCMVAFK